MTEWIVYFGWITFIISILGLYYNVHQNVKCFYIWSCTNVAWIIVDVNAGIWSQALMMFTNLIFAIYGIYRWEKIKKHS